MKQKNFCLLAQAVIEMEANAISNLSSRIDENFAKACELILDCKGHIVVMGIGKSGHISGKVAATLASTGTPAFFVHPGEASHGDMGMVTKNDLVLALSNSGETPEIITILPLIKRLGVKLITMTGQPNSTLAQMADLHIDVSVEKEACPLGLAPTCSSTAALAMGDALAIALLDAKGFTPDDFAMSHPGGNLGKKLLLKVEHLMKTGDRLPTVYPDVLLKEALMEMTQKGLGMTVIVEKDRKIVGVYTDGDLRRTLDFAHDIHQVKIKEVMTANCKTIPPSMLAVEALNIMETYKITSLIVSTPDQHLLGVVHMHDIVSAGV